MRGLRVVLAEDYFPIRHFIGQVLRAQASVEAVAEVDNGGDCIRLVQEISPDLAVIDFTLPDLSGLDVTRQVRKIRPSTKVVLIIDEMESEYTAPAIQAGAGACLRKDSIGKELVSFLETLHQYRS